MTKIEKLHKAADDAFDVYYASSDAIEEAEEAGDVDAIKEAVKKFHKAHRELLEAEQTVNEAYKNE
jgi:hypothetical protein